MAGLTGLFVAEDPEGTQPTGARQALGALIEGDPDGGPLDVKLGVFKDSGGAVVTGTSDMSYDIRAFRAVSALSSAIGPVVSTNDAPVNVDTDPAPGSNSRIDLIYCHQHLTAADGGPDDDSEFVFGVAIGDVAASPVAPTDDVPAGAIVLASVHVLSGTVGTDELTFTQEHEWTSARSGGVWRDWTPTVAGMVVDGAVYRYTEIGNTIIGQFNVNLAPGGSGDWSITPPFPPTSSARDRVIGTSLYYGADRDPGFVLFKGGDAKLYIMSTAGTIYTGATVDSDAWFSGTFAYERA